MISAVLCSCCGLFDLCSIRFFLLLLLLEEIYLCFLLCVSFVKQTNNFFIPFDSTCTEQTFPATHWRYATNKQKSQRISVIVQITSKDKFNKREKVISQMDSWLGDKNLEKKNEERKEMRGNIWKIVAEFKKKRVR